MKILAGLFFGLLSSCAMADTLRACVRPDDQKDEQDKCIAAYLVKDKAEAQAWKREIAKHTKTSKWMSDLVKKSKNVLVENYKDPTSAQFTKIVVSEDRVLGSFGEMIITNTVCGYVNGKNSYGGYVGSEYFYVQWTEGINEPTIWTPNKYSDMMIKYSDVPKALALVEKLKADQLADAQKTCDASATTRITKID
jgi:hypothetical protein